MEDVYKNLERLNDVVESLEVKTDQIITDVQTLTKTMEEFASVVLSKFDHSDVYEIYDQESDTYKEIGVSETYE